MYVQTLIVLAVLLTPIKVLGLIFETVWRAQGEPYCKYLWNLCASMGGIYSFL